ncbi:MAG: sigma 54-interacting transcriptional regulator [Gemmatimonadales bacterium]
MATVLIVDDEPNIRRMVGALLAAEGYEIREAATGTLGLAKAAEDEPDAVLLDLMMPGEFDGMATLARLRIAHPELPVIMMSGRAGLSDAVNATKLGAVNFLEKPLTPEGVLFAVGSALELRQSRRVARELLEELGLTGDMVGDSPQMLAVRELIDRVAASEARVLITGESGTGKELVASAIHDAGTRRDKPFVRVNCAAIPRDLVESEMFGHERGSFTGATQARMGRFELAHMGTLFLDEIGDLSLDAQAKLLRALEAKEIHRVGGNHAIRVDVRIIAATNHDLTRAVREGAFREDLFFRLNVIPIALPPLRQRDGDIQLLVRHFSLLHFKRTGQIPPTWTPEAMRVLERHSWPGNVRELANIVERIAIVSPGADVTGVYVARVLQPEAERAGTPRETITTAKAPSAGLNSMLDLYEREIIEKALRSSRGNVAEAARTLMTDRPNLYRRMKRLGLDGGRIALVLLALLFARGAQSQETLSHRDSTFDLRSILDRDDRGGLTITSGKTYNRVEGLPIFLGPTYRNRIGRADLSIAALGILRSSHGFHWDPENLGHRLSADLRLGRRRGFAVGATSFDLVAKVEPWQLTEPDGGLAAFFLKRDYFDYFGRHGARAYATAFAGDNASVTLGYGSERWTSRRARDVFTLFREDEDWRINPRINDGLVHLVDLNVDFDSRNSELRPWAGWFLNAHYERGAGNFDTEGTRLVPAGSDGMRRLEYGRAFLDLRRYNRISPRRQLNGRLVVGGWLHGDPLPLERRLSVGGIGTIPGFDFRRLGIGTDAGQCSPESGPLPGRPAECERVALAQLEYRHELVSELFDVFNRNGIRVRGAQFRVKPSAVAFLDAGRGWLVGRRQGELQYPSGSLPDFDTWRTDVGLGLDLGIAGIYVAKAVSASKEPANFFVRIRNRF